MLTHMPAASTGTKNPGPAAYQANRRALMQAAHRVFTARGAAAPLSAIATEAGVSQAVLYRHFPTREALADAISDERLGELEALASELDAHSFARVWARLMELTVEQAEIVTIMVRARHHHPEQPARLESLVARTLRVAVEAGGHPDEYDARDVLLAAQMVYGAVITAPPADRVATADAAVRLLPPGLVPR